MATNIENKVFEIHGPKSNCSCSKLISRCHGTERVTVFIMYWLASIYICLINNSLVGKYADAHRQVTNRYVILLLLSLWFAAKGSN